MEDFLKPRPPALEYKPHLVAALSSSSEPSPSPLCTRRLRDKLLRQPLEQQCLSPLATKELRDRYARPPLRRQRDSGSAHETPPDAPRIRRRNPLTTSSPRLESFECEDDTTTPGVSSIDSPEVNNNYEKKKHSLCTTEDDDSVDEEDGEDTQPSPTVSFKRRSSKEFWEQLNQIRRVKEQNWPWGSISDFVLVVFSVILGCLGFLLLERD